jgi:hypothetical protein
METKHGNVSCQSNIEKKYKLSSIITWVGYQIAYLTIINNYCIIINNHISKTKITTNANVISIHITGVQIEYATDHIYLG